MCKMIRLSSWAAMLSVNYIAMRSCVGSPMFRVLTGWCFKYESSFKVPLETFLCISQVNTLHMINLKVRSYYTAIALR